MNESDSHLTNAQAVTDEGSEDPADRYPAEDPHRNQQRSYNIIKSMFKEAS